MIGRWRLQFIAEMTVGTAFRQKLVNEDNAVNRLRSSTRGLS